MATFALIAEGITDQVTLEAILAGHYRDEHFINELQPTRDATDEKQGSFGGWEKVLEHCSFPDFVDAFSTNDYVIIQIDTDVCELVNFDIRLTDASGDKSVGALINEVKNFIIKKIGHDIHQKYSERIFFAISVHSLECWLLPLYGKTNNDRRKIKNCERCLSRVFLAAGTHYQKEYRPFLIYTKKFEKKTNLLEARKLNESLNIFLDSLPTLD